MASPRNEDRSVTRTYRAAVRLGEDYITLEEMITLPIDASDDEVQQAVELGWRVYQAQREAVERQIATIREQSGAAGPIIVRDPDAPASEKQRNYVAALQDDLGWTSDQLVAYASEHSVDLVKMTKGQASIFIDGLKKLADERARYGDAPRQAASVVERNPLSDRQLGALRKLAQTRGVDLDGETEGRYGVSAAELSDEEARELIGEWQRESRNGNARREAAL
jgi:nucleotide-binding universal stress UspA family protein